MDLDLYGEVNKEVSWLWLVVSLLMISCGEIVVVNCCGKTPIEGTIWETEKDLVYWGERLIGIKMNYLDSRPANLQTQSLLFTLNNTLKGCTCDLMTIARLW